MGGAEFRRKIGIADVTNAQLDHLTAILPGTSDVKFLVKGYARSGAGTGTGTGTGSTVGDDEEREVTLLVEGGTITYDAQGVIIEASGNAEKLLTFAYGGDFTTEFLARKSTVILNGDLFDSTPSVQEL